MNIRPFEMKKSLPIQVAPPIHGYPRHAYRLSIMSLQDAYIPWFFCNYIQLFAVDLLSDRKQNIRFNFYFSGPYIPPWLSIYTLPRRSIAKVYPQIVAFIRDQIDEGFYIHLMADEYFLPHTPFYGKVHNPHAILVFGYDDQTETLETLGFNRTRDYAVSRVAYSAFEEAFRWIDPAKHRSYRVELFEYNQEGSYEFDIDAVVDQLRAYLDSVNSSGHYRMLRSPIEGVFGMATYELLRAYLIYLCDHPMSWDRRHLFTLWEHKRCMLNRLSYLAAHGYLRPSAPFHGAYREVEQRAYQLLMMLLKVRVRLKTKRVWDVRRIDQIVTLMDDLSQKEACILRAVLKAL